MMFGYSNAWWLLLLCPVLLWVFLGPFVMLALGVRCAAAPGRRPRLWSVLLPSVPVLASAVFMVFPLSRWDRPVRVDGAVEPPAHLYDFLWYLTVYVGGVTVLPWLLGYGITRLTRFLRARRSGPERAREVRGPTGEADTV